MAEIAKNSIHENASGSLSLKIVSLTLVTTGDTYTIEPNAPVVDYWLQTHIGSATGPYDVSWSASTGSFTFTSGDTMGLCTLFILMRT